MIEGGGAEASREASSPPLSSEIRGSHYHPYDANYCQRKPDECGSNKVGLKSLKQPNVYVYVGPNENC
jgi:hypothetical protein